MPECGVNIWMNRSQWDDMLNTPIIIMPLHYYFKRVTLSRRPRPRPVCSDARTFRARFRSPHPRYESVWIVYIIIIIYSAIIHSLAHSLARYLYVCVFACPFAMSRARTHFYKSLVWTKFQNWIFSAQELCALNLMPLTQQQQKQQHKKRLPSIELWWLWYGHKHLKPLGKEAGCRVGACRFGDMASRF